MKMTMTATGDTILIQGFPQEGYEGLDEIRSYIAKGQARFGNLETCVTNWGAYPSYFSGGTWMNTTPRVLDQILSYGMNFIGFANNHTMDFGPDGLLETVEHVRERGVAITGAGKDLFEASRPVFRDFKGGRVAFIALTSTGGNVAARAGYASKELRGRPGCNGLRSSATIMLNEKHLEAVRKISTATGINRSDEISRANGFTPPLADNVALFGSLRFALTEGKEGKASHCDKNDLERILNSIRDAQFIADYVVVMFHGHEIRGSVITEPADFHTELAHACIDAGASAFLGGGTHEFKPVEIYQGKPIFYSLGNFCFQSNMVEHQPADMKDKYNLSHTVSDVQALAARNKDWTIGQHTQVQNFRTCIPYMEFEDGKLTHLELKPVELGFDKRRTEKGVPYPAKGEEAKTIYNILSGLSRPYGTEMTQGEDGIITVHLS